MIKALKRFWAFEVHMTKDWIDTMWGQMNIVGKIAFLPFNLFGTVIVPIVVPLVWSVLLVCTYKRKRHTVPETPEYTAWEAYTELRVALTAIGITHEAIRYSFEGNQITALSDRIFEANQAVKKCRDKLDDSRTFEDCEDEVENGHVV